MGLAPYPIQPHTVPMGSHPEPHMDPDPLPAPGGHTWPRSWLLPTGQGHRNPTALPCRTRLPSPSTTSMSLRPSHPPDASCFPSREAPPGAAHPTAPHSVGNVLRVPPPYGVRTPPLHPQKEHCLPPHCAGCGHTDVGSPIPRVCGGTQTSSCQTPPPCWRLCLGWARSPPPAPSASKHYCQPCSLRFPPCSPGPRSADLSSSGSSAAVKITGEWRSV